MEVIVEPSLVSYGFGCFPDCCVVDCDFCGRDCSDDCGSYGRSCGLNFSRESRK